MLNEAAPFYLYFRIFACVVYLLFVLTILPTVWMEMWVENGLGRLRKLLFSSIGVSVLAVSIYLCVLMLWAMFEIPRVFVDLSGVLTSCVIIIAGLTLNIIYAERYHPKNHIKQPE